MNKLTKEKSVDKKDSQENIEMVLKAAVALVIELNKTIDKALPQKLANIVKQHAFGVLIASALVAWVPLIGPITAFLLLAIIIWSMYFRINKAIDVPLGKNIIKTVISGVCTNLGANLVLFLAATAISLLPVIGSVIADIIIVSMTYAVTLACGIFYLKMLTKLFKAQKDPTFLSMEHIQELVENVRCHEDVAPCLDKANELIREQQSQVKAAVQNKIIAQIAGTSTDSHNILDAEIDALDKYEYPSKKEDSKKLKE